MSLEVGNIAPVFYGITMVPTTVWREYGYALLTIAGADGEVSDPELEWLTIQCAEYVGVEESVIAEWEEFDFEEAALEEIFHSFNTKSFANFNKLLIYDAIRMCSADGEYAQDEKESVYKAAQLLNVSPETVMAIEALVDIEEAANKLRMTVL
ncbi:MAG: TerB family tellurite resistance protein [Bacteroidota bacterium]